MWKTYFLSTYNLKDFYLYLSLLLNPLDSKLFMEHKTKQNPVLIALVSDFEERNISGDQKYLTDKSYIQLIEYYEDDQQIEKAVEVVDCAIEQYSYRSGFIITKARLLLQLGEIQNACELLDTAESIAPFENEIKILRAKALGISGDCSTALEILSELKVSAVGSDLADILVCESYVFEYIKDYESMYTSLRKALEVNINHEEAAIRYWMAIELSRKYKEGMIVYKDIIDSDPYNYRAWFHLGHSFAATGEYEDAIDAIEYSFLINKNFESGYMDCADLCFQLRKFDRALYYYTEANNLFGPESDILINIAECQVKLSKHSDAKANLFEALKLDPYNDELFYHLADCYSTEKSWYKAINAYHKAIDIEDRCEDYYHGLAKAYTAIENYDKSIFYFRKAALTGLEQSCYWQSYTTALIKLGQLEKALKVLSEADQFTFGADLMYCEAAIHLIKCDKTKGMRILEEALLEDFSTHRLLFEIQPELELDPDVSSMINYYRSEFE